MGQIPTQTHRSIEPRWSVWVDRSTRALPWIRTARLHDRSNRSRAIAQSHHHRSCPWYTHRQEARRGRARSIETMEVIIGCVGKPSVGKSTFFNAVTDGKVCACFCMGSNRLGRFDPRMDRRSREGGCWGAGGGGSIDMTEAPAEQPPTTTPSPPNP